MPEEEFIQSPYERPRKRPRDWSQVRTIVLLVSALAVGLYFFAPGILKPLLKPLGLGPGHQELPDDPEGKKYLSILETRHSFLTNQGEGDLLVVTGLVKNYYASGRRLLRVRGQLFDIEGRVLDQKTVYCGSWLDRDALESRPYPDLQKTFESEEARNHSRTDSGRSIPFQIVFTHVSGGFSSYTIEAAGSEKAD